MSGRATARLRAVGLVGLAGLRGLFVLLLAAGAALWAQQLSKEYIHAGERLLAVKVPGMVGTGTGLRATLVADSYLITAGDETTLTWSTTNATSVSIDQGVGAVTPVEGGSRSVMPRATTTYTLTAVGEGVSVSVMPGIRATLVADPFQITAGEAVTLRWTTSGATSATLDPGGEPIDTAELASGSKTVTPAAATTYLLTASGDAGTASASASVTVGGGTATTAPTATLVADPVLITAGESTTLTWTTSNAASASIDQGVGALTPLAGGRRSVTPTATTTYTLTAVGEGGSVTAMPGITASLVADPFQITPGGTATLRWTTSGATSAMIDQGVGAATPLAGGSVSVSPTANTTYTLSATGDAGTATASAHVNTTTSTQPACPVIDTFSALPLSITAGGSSTLRWETSDADSVTISGVTGALAVDGSTTVSPSADTTYTLTASGASCTPASAAITVTVTTTMPPELPDPFAPTAALSANPATIDAGESSTLTWATTDAVSATIEPDLGTVTPRAAGEVVRMHMKAYDVPFGTDLYYAGHSDPLEAGSDAVIDELGETIYRIWWRRDSSQFDIGITTSAGGTASSYWGAGLAGASKSIFIYSHADITAGIEISFDDFVSAGTNRVRFSVTDATRNIYLDNLWSPDRWTMIIADAGALSLHAPPAAGGSVTVTPTETTSYTLTARGPGGLVTSNAPVTVNPAGPVIDTFTADATTITAGQSTTLRWTTSGATAVSIPGASGTLEVDGSVSVSPTQTTTYELTASDDDDATADATAEVTVTVNPAGPVIDTFTATSTTITAGESTTLRWTTTGATTVSISDVTGDLAVDGSTSVSPTATTIYTLTASDDDDATADATATVTVTVNAAAPVIDTFTATSTTITAGESTTLEWTTTNATAVSISDVTGDLAVDGSTSVSPTATTIYTLTASDDDDATADATASVTVTVNAAPVIDYFNPHPASIREGDSTILSWLTTNATSASIDQGVGTVTPVEGGITRVRPTTDTTYTLTAGNGAGAEATATATVTVIPSTHTVDSFTVDDTTPSVGDSVTFTWTTSNADSAALQQEFSIGFASLGSVDLNGSRSVSRDSAGSATYRLSIRQNNHDVHSSPITITWSESP